MVNSRNKGKVYELQLAAFLRDLGYSESRRGQQYSGLGGDDVVGVPGIHVECKAAKSVSIHSWVEQSQRDAGDDLPTVWWRRVSNVDRGNPWCVTFPASLLWGFLVSMMAGLDDAVFDQLQHQIRQRRDERVN